VPDQDLTTEPEPSTTEPIRTEPYDPRPRREQLRGYLALGLLLLVSLVIVAALIGMFVSLEINRIKDIIGLILTPLVGLLSAVTGFYFASVDRDE
jgi:hypothetical protein